MSDKGLNGQKQYLKDFLTNKLTRTERLIVVLYYYDEMTIPEIAKSLDLSPSKVYQMRSRIISRCKSYLQEQEFS